MTEPFEHVDRKFDNDPEQKWIASYMKHMLELKGYTEKLFRFKQRWSKYLITANFLDVEELRWSPKDVELKRFAPRDNDGEAILAWNRSSVTKTVRIKLRRGYNDIILARPTSDKRLRPAKIVKFILQPNSVCALILKP